MSRLTLLGAGGPLAAPLLLDTLSGSSSAAYSTRKLRTAYTGACIRIRRDNDNAEQDIGFSAYRLDDAAIALFVGVNNGFIVKWYDQSGNGVDAVQSTAANQPKIVNSGTIYTIGSPDPRPAILFVRSSSYYLTLGQQMNSDNVSKSYVIKLVSVQGQAYSNFDAAGFYAGCDSLYSAGSAKRRHYQYHGSPDFSTKTLTSTATRGTSNVYLEMFRRNHSSGKTLNFWLDGIGDGDTTYTQTGAIAASAGHMAIGRSGSYNGDYLDGYLTEMMFFGSALSASDLNLIGQSQSAEYGPTWTTIT